ncbi:MAG: hypothetical protein JW900_15265 [Anaerolineae bacterium]|nr:hypothetical protein [Anaerolineae bacterium]
MSRREPLFSGLVYNEEGESVETAYVGTDACYAIPDGDFLRHIDAAEVDRQVLLRLKERFMAMKDMIVDGVMQMTSSDDPFSRAAIEMSIENMDRLLDAPQELGDLEDMRLWLWMSGFRIVVDVHGEVVQLEFPGME